MPRSTPEIRKRAKRLFGSNAGARILGTKCAIYLMQGRPGRIQYLAVEETWEEAFRVATELVHGDEEERGAA